MKILFADANLFLQCRDLEQLPWHEVAEGNDQLFIIIPRQVQVQIDRLKQDGNNRRARRARKATSLIREVIQENGEKKIIKESTPRVEIGFSPPQDILFEPPKSLDITQTDDRIIAEALAYKHLFRDADVALLTNDTNPLLTAKRCGLPYILIPDTWLLPPEPDPRDKKIEELERRLKDLNRNVPEIAVVSQAPDKTAINLLSITVVLYEKLTEAEIGKLLTDAQIKCPIETKFEDHEIDKPPYSRSGLFPGIFPGAFPGTTYRRPTESEIRKYTEEMYPQWLDNLRELLVSLPNKLESPNRHRQCFFSVFNNGTVPAENTIIEFKAQGGLLIKLPPQSEKEETKDTLFTPPPPPIAPKGGWVSVVTGINLQPVYERSLPIFPIYEKHDRYAFYWKNGRPSGYRESLTLECDEFRHQVEPETFDFLIYVPPSVQIKKGALTCRVTAKNLPTPFEYILPIAITYDQGAIIKQAEYLLNLMR